MLFLHGCYGKNAYGLEGPKKARTASTLVLATTTRKNSTRNFGVFWRFRAVYCLQAFDFRIVAPARDSIPLNPAIRQACKGALQSGLSCAICESR
jgi:hypothetical protein